MDKFKNKVVACDISGKSLIEFEKLLTIALQASEFNPSPVDIAHQLRELDINNLRECKANINAILEQHGITTKP